MVPDNFPPKYFIPDIIYLLEALSVRFWGGVCQDSLLGIDASRCAEHNINNFENYLFSIDMVSGFIFAQYFFLLCDKYSYFVDWYIFNIS